MSPRKEAGQEEKVVAGGQADETTLTPVMKRLVDENRVQGRISKLEMVIQKKEETGTRKEGNKEEKEGGIEGGGGEKDVRKEGRVSKVNL